GAAAAAERFDRLSGDPGAPPRAKPEEEGPVADADGYLPSAERKIQGNGSSPGAGIFGAVNCHGGAGTGARVPGHSEGQHEPGFALSPREPVYQGNGAPLQWHEERDH